MGVGRQLWARGAASNRWRKRLYRDLGIPRVGGECGHLDRAARLGPLAGWPGERGNHRASFTKQRRSVDTTRIPDANQVRSALLDTRFFLVLEAQLSISRVRSREYLNSSSCT